MAKRIHICGELCDTAKILTLHPENQESSKSIRMVKRRVCILFAGLFGTVRRHSVTFSAFSWSFDKAVLCTKRDSCETKDQSFIFALECKNNNEFHTMLESWAVRKTSKIFLLPPTAESGQHWAWQMANAETAPGAPRLPGGAQEQDNGENKQRWADRRIGKM